MPKKITAIATLGYYLFLTTSTLAADGTLTPVGVDPNAVKPEAVPQLLVNGLFFVAAVLAVLYFMYGGIKWITSRGDKIQVEAARKHIVAAVIGMVVVAGAFFAMQTLFTVLGADNPLKNGFKFPTLKDANK